MTMITRRHLLAAGSALAGLSVLPVSAFAVDIAEFNKAPDLGEMSLGAEESKVTLTEYASATCPHCAAFHSETYGIWYCYSTSPAKSCPRIRFFVSKTS